MCILNVCVYERGLHNGLKHDDASLHCYHLCIYIITFIVVYNATELKLFSLFYKRIICAYKV